LIGGREGGDSGLCVGMIGRIWRGVVLLKLVTESGDGGVSFWDFFERNIASLIEKGEQNTKNQTG
jgi:hypothetical protein